MRGVVAAILDSGRSLARQRKSRVPLLYQWHDKDYLGAAHGTAGILFMLMQVRNSMRRGRNRKMKQPKKIFCEWWFTVLVGIVRERSY